MLNRKFRCPDWSMAFDSFTTCVWELGTCLLRWLFVLVLLKRSASCCCSFRGNTPSFFRFTEMLRGFCSLFCWNAPCFLLVPGKRSLWWHELYMWRHELYMWRHKLYMWRHKLCGYICKRRIYIKRKGCHPTALPESSFEAYEKLLEFTRDPLGARTQDPHIKSVMLYQLS